MQVPEKLQKLCDGMQQEFGAERFYVVDIDEEPREGLAGTIVLGMRKAATPALAVRLKAGQVLQELVQQPVGVEVFTEPLDEVEYLFDRYLREYIASHGGIVTPVKVEEPEGKLWITMDGGCSGCPSSIATLKHGIERTLKKHLPWVERVETVEEPAEPDFNIKIDFSALSLGPPQAERGQR